MTVLRIYIPLLRGSGAFILSGLCSPPPGGAARGVEVSASGRPSSGDHIVADRLLFRRALPPCLALCVDRGPVFSDGSSHARRRGIFRHAAVDRWGALAPRFHSGHSMVRADRPSGRITRAAAYGTGSGSSVPQRRDAAALSQGTACRTSSEARRVGKEWVRTCSSRGWRYH